MTRAVLVAVAVYWSGAAACAPTGSPRPPAAGEPLSVRVLRAVGVPAPLTLVRPEMTYAELVAARPASAHAVGIGREEWVEEWLAWYFFDSPSTPAGSPAAELDRSIHAEPREAARMRHADFKRDVRAREAERVWATAVARAQAAGGRAARCSRFQMRRWRSEQEVRNGLRAYVPLDTAPGGLARRLIIGVATAAATPDAPAQRRDSVAARPGVLVITLEVVPENDVWPFMETGGASARAAARRGDDAASARTLRFRRNGTAARLALDV
jgi:hypothetical protein